jgi:hypothetical protein
MDTTSITAAITTALTAVGVVGAAIMGVHVAVKAFKWVRAALS